MTNKIKILGLCLAALVMALASGCKSKSKAVRADSYESETIVDLANKDSQNIDYKSKLGNNHHAKASSADTDPTPIDGKWTIIGTGDKEIRQDSEMPYVIFSDDDERFYAFNGCNVINGDFTFNAKDNTVTFANVLSTTSECPDVSYQQDISVVLNDGVSVKTDLEHKGAESYLLLKSKSNDLLLTMRRNNMDVLNGQWIVTDIGDTEIDKDGINVFLDIPLQTIHGNTGCNYFNGKIDVDPFDAHAISFTQMGVTMSMCENADLERKMLVALEEVTHFKLTDQNTLLLLGDDDKCLMKLTRDTSISTAIRT